MLVRVHGRAVDSVPLLRHSLQDAAHYGLDLIWAEDGDSSSNPGPSILQPHFLNVL